MRLKVLRLFHIIRGLFRGCLTHKQFSVLFDWFYPEYFGVVQQCLSAYLQPPCDDDVVVLILKFLQELVDNSSNRLRFDTWSINGLIVYKESAELMITFLNHFGCLNSTQKAVLHGDEYKERLRFLKVSMTILHKCIIGNYINFAICEYYNDNSFATLSQYVMQSILNQDLTQIRAYKKLNMTVYNLTEEFFKKHLELVFLRFNQGLLVQLIDNVIIPGIHDEAFEIKSCALLTVDFFNEFIFTNLKKPSKKQPDMAQNVQNFYSQQSGLFEKFLRNLAYTLLFEDHKNIWIFQKCIHSTIVMCEGGAASGVRNSYKIISEVIQ